MADMDDENSALIARLLQQDSGGYDSGGFISDPSEDDCDEYGKKRKKKGKGRGGTKKKTAKVNLKAASKKQSQVVDAQEAINNSDAKPRRRTPRTWTEDEERLFLEALELYGRKWTDCATHIGSGRMGRDVASHAQKHFIKLFKEGKPLPEKVRETGEGYTLSGKPLDPNSAAARAYGLGGTDSQKQYRESLAKSDSGTANRSSSNSDKKAASDAAKIEREKAKATRLAENERKQRIAREAKEKKRLEEARRKGKQVYDEDGLTAYSRNRTRRKAVSRYVTAPTGELQFVVCSSYSGAPGSMERKAQPFAVSVHSSACLVVDLHAHTSTAEVMGFLAGKWDARRRLITVTAAFPGRSTTAGETECEMDPVVEVQLRSTIESKGLSVVGWYHSHPTFDAIPSMCDIDNQTNYQTLFRDGKSGTEPFVALIASPYNETHGTQLESVFSWFYVKGPVMSKTPMRIETEFVADPEITQDARERMDEIVESFGSCPLSVNFNNAFSEALTYGEKLSAAFRRWIPPVSTLHAKASMEQRVLAGTDSSQVLLPPEDVEDQTALDQTSEFREAALDNSDENKMLQGSNQSVSTSSDKKVADGDQTSKENDSRLQENNRLTDDNLEKTKTDELETPSAAKEYLDALVRKLRKVKF